MNRVYKKGISIFLPVYNEEKRIYYTLSSLIWCDEVILLDKCSNDRTIQIASQFSNVRIITKEEGKAYTSSEYEIYLEECQYKYSMTVTASDIIHPFLAQKIKDKIQDENFDYDAINIPYRGYFLGIYEKYSPWFSESSTKIIKTNLIQLRRGEVHTACNNEANTVYVIKTNSVNEAYFHLTHESAEGIIERHTRYWRGEALSPEPLNKSLTIVFKKFVRFLIIKRTFFKGKAAIALAFSFLTYYMMSYVYKWDYQFGNAEDLYSDLRNKILEEWRKNEQIK